MQENPYAPSLADQTREAPRSRGWRIEGGRLLVEPEAILPMIDPYTGETGERMTLMRVVLRRRVRWPRFLMLGGVVLVVVSPAFGFGEEIAGFGILFCLVGFFASSWVSASRNPLTVFVFLGQRNVRLNLAAQWIVTAILVMGIGLIVASPHLPKIGLALGNVFSLAFVLTLVVLFLLRWPRRNLCWRRTREGEREMLGVSRRAMELLAEERQPTAGS